MLAGHTDVALDIPRVTVHPSGWLSYPVYHQDFLLVEMLPNLRSPTLNVLQVFSGSTWLALAMTIASMTMILAFQFKNDFKMAKTGEVAMEAFLTAFGSLFQEFRDLKCLKFSPLWLLWLLGLTLLVNSYHGNLKSSLIRR